MRIVSLLALLLISGCGCGPPMPAIEGEYGIGRIDFALTDESRDEERTDDPDDKREMMVHVFYPTDEDGPGTAYTYPASELSHDLLNAYAGRVIPVQPGATLSDGEDAWPVVVYSAGYPGNAFGLMHVVMALASRGYVVVGVDHPYYANRVDFPDGRDVRIDKEHLERAWDDEDVRAEVAEVWSADQRFALEHLRSVTSDDDAGGDLAGRLDFARLALYGHHMGATAAALTGARWDGDVPRAFVGSDPLSTPALEEAGLAQPSLRLATPPDACGGKDYCEAYHAAYYDAWEAMLEQQGRDGGEAMHVTVEGALVGNFSLGPVGNPISQWAGATGELDGATSMALTVDYVVAFFDRHVRGLDAPLLDEDPSPYEEVTVKRWPDG